MELSIRQVEDFMQEPVWKELVHTWEERKVMLTNEILNCVGADDQKLTNEDIHYRRGQIKDLDFSIIQPELIMEELKEQAKIPELNEENSDG